MRPEKVIHALLAALGELGTQDLYTDAQEYNGRVGAMQELCVLAQRIVDGEVITLDEVEEAALGAEVDCVQE